VNGLQFAIPEPVRLALGALRQAHRQAYIVGGAVRDLLRGLKPQDYDLATDAPPEEVAAIVSARGWKAVDRLGMNLGVTVAIIDGCPIEITTFRGERYGSDAHRPAQVWYAATLAEDLSRRDFTINAMALDAAGELVDPWGGAADLAQGIIRTVGDPAARFAEDALRMFRACRFAAQLGFSVDPALAAAIPGCLHRTAGLAVERIRNEIDKMLAAAHPAAGLDLFVRSGLAAARCRRRIDGQDTLVEILPELGHLVDLPQNSAYHRFDAWRHTLATVEGVRPEPALRWAALLHDVGKGLDGVRGVNRHGAWTDFGHARAGAEIARTALIRLGYGTPLVRLVRWLVASHMRLGAHSNWNMATAVRWVRKEAVSGGWPAAAALAGAFRLLGELGAADAAAAKDAPEQAAALAAAGNFLAALAEKIPVRPAELAVRGQDLLLVLGSGQQIGLFLKAALRRVQDGALANDRESLLKAAQRWQARKAAVQPAARDAGDEK